MASRTLITAALPYANGPVHLGHMVEYIQADIYARFLKSCGVDAIFLCADDTHGTPIELNAAKQGLKPEEFIARWHEQHQNDFRDFDVHFDAYGSTHSTENREWAERIYKRLVEAGDIDRREIEQTYCEKDARFLPDRFIRGTCPNCKAPDQYGDVCERCGKTYSPTDLVEPKCALCGTPPIRRKSTHLFFTLSKHADLLKERLKEESFIHGGTGSQLGMFFEKGLSDWDISRDGPYFGFAIPGEQDKYFYVWLDAPIGYIATTEQWAQKTGEKKGALAYWDRDSDATIIHFIGKDIVYFHALFWPAVLHVAGLKQPKALKVHGHLTVNGEKMSKSRGTLIAARTYLSALDASYLRYFYAASLGSGPEDLDLSLKEFRLRVNGELVNNVGNLANRALSLLAGTFGTKLAAAGQGPGRELVEAALARVPEIRAAYERNEYRLAMKLITEISQSANQFIQAQAPWAKAKTDLEAARADVSDAAEVAYLVAALLSPVVPRLSAKLFGQLNAPELTFKGLETASYPLLDRTRAIGTPEPLIARIEEKQLETLVPPPDAAAEKAAKPAKAEKKAEAKKAEPEGPPAEIEYDDFVKVALRVGKVVAAERVPKADKLLKLTVEVGEAAPRTIAAGIAEAYTPEAVTGRNVVVVMNLKPRMLRGIESRGMLLAAGPGGKDLSLVDPGALPPGSEVK